MGFARARSLSPAGLLPPAEFLSPLPKPLKGPRLLQPAGRFRRGALRLDVGTQATMRRTRRIHVLVLLTLVIAAMTLLVLLPGPRPGSVSVRLLTLTNDAGGNRLALFLATNSTDRLFVRGRSELECRGGASNVISVLQIKNVDYLQPGEAITFAIPCDTWLDPWRLKFHYIGQFHLREAIVHESGLFLQRKRLLPDPWSGMTWLLRHQEYNIATEWVCHPRNAHPDGPADGSQPTRSETNRTSSSDGAHR